MMQLLVLLVTLVAVWTTVSALDVEDYVSFHQNCYSFAGVPLSAAAAIDNAYCARMRSDAEQVNTFQETLERARGLPAATESQRAWIAGDVDYIPPRTGPNDWQHDTPPRQPQPTPDEPTPEEGPPDRVIRDPPLVADNSIDGAQVAPVVGGTQPQPGGDEDGLVLLSRQDQQLQAVASATDAQTDAEAHTRRPHRRRHHHHHLHHRRQQAQHIGPNTDDDTIPHFAENANPLLKLSSPPSWTSGPRWPNAIIPHREVTPAESARYRNVADLSREAAGVLVESMQDWERDTCAFFQQDKDNRAAGLLVVSGAVRDAGECATEPHGFSTERKTIMWLSGPERNEIWELRNIPAPPTPDGSPPLPLPPFKLKMTTRLIKESQFFNTDDKIGVIQISLQALVGCFHDPFVIVKRATVAPKHHFIMEFTAPHVAVKFIDADHNDCAVFTYEDNTLNKIRFGWRLDKRCYAVKLQMDVLTEYVSTDIDPQAFSESGVQGAILHATPTAADPPIAIVHQPNLADENLLQLIFMGAQAGGQRVTVESDPPNAATLTNTVTGKGHVWDEGCLKDSASHELGHLWFGHTHQRQDFAKGSGAMFSIIPACQKDPQFAPNNDQYTTPTVFPGKNDAIKAREMMAGSIEIYGPNKGILVKDTVPTMGAKLQAIQNMIGMAEKPNHFDTTLMNQYYECFPISFHSPSSPGLYDRVFVHLGQPLAIFRLKMGRVINNINEVDLTFVKNTRFSLTFPPSTNGGTFKVTVDGFTTEPIPYDRNLQQTAMNVQDALTDLSVNQALASGRFASAIATGGKVEVTLMGIWGGKPIDAFAADGARLYGSNKVVTPALIVKGGQSLQAYRVDYDGVVTAGSYTLTIEGLAPTAPIGPLDGTAEIQRALDGVAGAGNAIVTGDAPQFSIQFTNGLALAAHKLDVTPSADLQGGPVRATQISAFNPGIPAIGGKKKLGDYGFTQAAEYFVQTTPLTTIVTVVIPRDPNSLSPPPEDRGLWPINLDWTLDQFRDLASDRRGGREVQSITDEDALTPLESGPNNGGRTLRALGVVAGHRLTVVMAF